MEDLLILIAVISIIFGILQIILFCKIWGMTNDIRDLRSEFIGGTDQWTLRKAILKGDKNRIAELLFNDMFYRIKKYYNDSIPDPDGCKKKALEEQISSLKKEYKKKYGEIDSESDKWIDWKEKYGIASSVTYPRIKSTIEGFKHKKDFKTSLLEKKLTASSLSRIDTVLAQIEEIKEREKNNYTDIKVVVEDNTVKLLGIVKKAKEIEGIPSNLKYYKCDWTERHPEDYFLSNALCLHIKEMIELQNAIEINECKNLLLLNKSDIEKAMKLKKEQIESIWLNQSIIVGKEEMKFLNEVGFKYIPREFFGQELKEAAE